MLSAVLLALSAAAVNADYIQSAQFGSANCAGTPLARSVSFLSCQSAGSGFWRAVACTNSTWGVVNFYTTSTCTGPAATSPAPSVINGFSWGCSASGSQSSEGTCVTGAWAAPASSLAVVNYPNSPVCPVNTSADNAIAYSVGSCLSFGSASVRASCTSSSYSVTSFPSADCSGSGTAATGSIGCAPNTGSSGSQPGVSVYQCTSGASSASIAFASIALMLVAAASASAL